MAWDGQQKCIIGSVVSENKRKMLERLDQKVRGQEPRLKPHRSQMEPPRRRDATFPMQGHRGNVVSL